MVGVLASHTKHLILQYDGGHISRLSQKLVDGITSQLDHVIRNGDPEHTYDGMHQPPCDYHLTAHATA